MKKLLSGIFIAFVIAQFTPVFAINDVNATLQKEEAKYKLKVEKLKRKQELQCIKHPEKCTTSPMKETNLTLGTAQKNIKIGMSQADVALVLGSPNIVTTDSDGKETWIYDKVSSVSSYNSNGFSIYGSIILAGVGHNKSGGNAQSSQKTLTIVIKFNKNKVESFKYHMSNF